MKKCKFITLALSLISLVGCPERNPIHGKWKLQKSEEFGLDDGNVRSWTIHVTDKAAHTLEINESSLIFRDKYTGCDKEIKSELTLKSKNMYAVRSIELSCNPLPCESQPIPFIEQFSKDKSTGKFIPSDWQDILFCHLDNIKAVNSGKGSAVDTYIAIENGKLVVVDALEKRTYIRE